MQAIKSFVAVALIAFTLPVGAAELPLPPVHHAHKATVHRAYAVTRWSVHFGYYWGQWGWRCGGTARSWYGSTFALLGPAW